jgi:hypothetical protein
MHILNDIFLTLIPVHLLREPLEGDLFCHYISGMQLSVVNFVGGPKSSLENQYPQKQRKKHWHNDILLMVVVIF